MRTSNSWLAHIIFSLHWRTHIIDHTNIESIFGGSDSLAPFAFLTLFSFISGASKLNTNKTVILVHWDYCMHKWLWCRCIAHFFFLHFLGDLLCCATAAGVTMNLGLHCTGSTYINNIFECTWRIYVSR